MNTPALRDIHGPVALPGDWWWLWLIAGFLAIGALYWGFCRIRLFLRKPAGLAPVIPPWEKALAELLRLEKMRPESKEEVKAFYSFLSGIVRWYIEERFNIRAPEMTTEEFMERVRVSPGLTSAQQDFLRQFLSLSDMVKFARHETSSADRAEAVGSARRFVEETRPPVAVPKKGEA